MFYKKPQTLQFNWLFLLFLQVGHEKRMLKKEHKLFWRRHDSSFLGCLLSFSNDQILSWVATGNQVIQLVAIGRRILQIVGIGSHVLKWFVKSKHSHTGSFPRRDSCKLCWFHFGKSGSPLLFGCWVPCSNHSCVPSGLLQASTCVQWGGKMHPV